MNSAIKNYKFLESEIEKVFQINNAVNILYWDLSISAPNLSKETKMKEIITLKNLSFQILTSQHITDLIGLASQEKTNLNNWQIRNLELIERRSKLAQCIDEKLQKTHDANLIECEELWKKTSDYKQVRPYLDKIITSTKEIAKTKGSFISTNQYAVLVDNYDPHRKLSTLKNLYSNIKQTLPGIISKVIEKQKSEVLIPISDCLDKKQQNVLNRKIMSILGFDFDYGRIDESNHNFCGGAPDDVRLMIKNGKNYLENIMRVVHETGHGLYEQNLPKDYKNQPVGKAAGMAMHESQSLILEMQILKSKEFMSLLSKIFRDDFQLKGAEFQEDNLYKHITRITPSMIRLGSDELTYLLHVILRSEIEEDLISGNLSLNDLPTVWNEKMQLYLGIKPDSNKNGCLQDIHWFRGYIGYFPTYCVGAMISSMLMHKIDQENQGILSDISQGNFDCVNSWLNKNIRNFGSLKTVDDLIKESTGKELSTSDYFSYVEKKYL